MPYRLVLMKTYGTREITILLLVAVASFVLLYWVFDMSLGMAIAYEVALVALALLVMYFKNKRAS